MKIHIASYFAYLHLFYIFTTYYLRFYYIIAGVKIGNFSSINQLFSHNSEFKISTPAVMQTSFNIAFGYDVELLLFKQTYLRGRSILAVR